MTAPGKEAEARKVVAEAVAFGKLVMLREVLDALHADRSRLVGCRRAEVRPRLQPCSARRRGHASGVEK